MASDGPTTLDCSTVCQIAIVVEDIEAAAHNWADLLGVEVPGWRLTGPKEESHVRYRGQSTEGRAKLAFLQMDNISIELIEPVGGPSVWQEVLDARGECVHHIAFHTGDMRTSVKYFEEAGIMEDQHGGWGTGEYAYMNGSGSIELIIELLEHYEQ